MYCDKVGSRDVYEATAKACPQLRRFMMHKDWSLAYTNYLKFGREVLGVAKMHELRSLILLCCDVTREQLVCMLDGCTHLDLLDLRGCPKLGGDNDLKARCAGISSVKLPRRRYDRDYDGIQYARRWSDYLLSDSDY